MNAQNIYAHIGGKLIMLTGFKQNLQSGHLMHSKFRTTHSIKAIVRL